MDKESIRMTEHVQQDPTSFHPLGKHDLDKAEERHGVFDHSDGRLVVDPEEAKLEVCPCLLAVCGSNGSLIERLL